MAPKAAFAGLLALSTIALAASLCVPGEPHVDCNFHGLSSPKWAELSAKAPELTAAWKAAVAKTPSYPAGQFAGRGLVITATKVDMVNVPVLLEILQSEGFNLPVEIWYSGEVDSEIIDVLSSAYKKLVIKNVANYASAEDLQSTSTSQGEHVFQVKPLAIINSEFEEVLFLDADNIPMSNPAALFDSAEYQSTGALFWPDFWQTATENPIWSILNLSPSGFEQESGQLVINKKTSWAALHLAFFLAKDSTFQQLVNGDKEAFRLAFLATATPFYMVQTPVASAGTLTDGAFCGHTMVQHDALGEALFLHHNSYKHGAAISWDVMKSVASAASSFSMVPLPVTIIDREPVSCIDMVGDDVKTTPAPFTAFERVYAQTAGSTDASLKAIAKQEFISVFNEQRRRLLVANGTAFACDPSVSTCYAASGTFFICCSVPCDQGFAANGDPICPGTNVGGIPGPAPGPVTVLPGPSGTCDPYGPNPNQCYASDGLSSVCCSTSCGSTPGTCA